MLATLALVVTLWSANDVVTPIGAVDDTVSPTAGAPYLRTAWETALVLVGGTIWYLRDANEEKWSRGLQWTAWRRKFMAEDVTFDGDHFNTNSLGHPLGGTAYYQIARGNGLGPGASFVSSMLASTFWEYFVEIPEHPSLNDMILTPAAGAVIGEATYRLGRYFATSGSGAARCAGSLLFAPIAALNDRPLCRAQPRPRPWAQLGVLGGVNRAVFDGAEVRDELMVAAGAEIKGLHAYQRAGAGSVAVGPGQFTSLYADGRFGTGRLQGAWLDAQAVWAGRYDRNYLALGDDTDAPGVSRPVEGWGLLVGLGSAFDYRLRELPRWHDRIGSIGLAGPVIEFSRRNGTLLRASLSAQYAFAIVGSMAYREAVSTLFGQDIKTSLRDGGYYYGHGVVSAATLLWDLGPIGFNAAARGGWFWSINEGDPAQSTIQRDVTLHDSRLYLTAGMWSRPLLGAARFGLGVEHVRRLSTMLDTIVTSSELDVMATAAIGF